LIPPEEFDPKLKNQIVIELNNIQILLGIYFALNKRKSKQMEATQCL